MSSRIQPEVPVQETGSNTIVEKRYQNMKTKDTKYTDVTRTSSASFKPPMSKDSTVRKPVETQQQRDSSWFSYIKNMFGTKPPADNPVKDLENKIDTVRMKSVPAKETRYERPVKSVKAEVTKPLAEGPKTSPIRQKEQPSAMLGVLEQKTKPQNVSSSPAVIKNQKDNTITNTSSTLISPMEEEIEGQYKSFRNGENASTFLHAPDKRGTTSFRITTNPKLCKPQPTLLSPTVLSKVKKPTKLGRKSSTSPRKVSPKDTSGPHSRLRSKSTPDSSNARPRPVSDTTCTKSLSLKSNSQKQRLFKTGVIENERVGVNAKTLSKPSFHIQPTILDESTSVSDFTAKKALGLMRPMPLDVKSSKSLNVIDNSSTILRNAHPAANIKEIMKPTMETNTNGNKKIKITTMNDKCPPRKITVSADSPTFIEPSMPKKSESNLKKDLMAKYVNTLKLKKTKLERRSSTPIDDANIIENFMEERPASRHLALPVSKLSPSLCSDETKSKNRINCTSISNNHAKYDNSADNKSLITENEVDKKSQLKLRHSQGNDKTGGKTTRSITERMLNPHEVSNNKLPTNTTAKPTLKIDSSMRVPHNVSSFSNCTITPEEKRVHESEVSKTCRTEVNKNDIEFVDTPVTVQSFSEGIQSAEVNTCSDTVEMCPSEDLQKASSDIHDQSNSASSSDNFLTEYNTTINLDYKIDIFCDDIVTERDMCNHALPGKAITMGGNASSPGCPFSVNDDNLLHEYPFGPTVDVPNVIESTGYPISSAHEGGYPPGSKQGSSKQKSPTAKNLNVTDHKRFRRFPIDINPDLLKQNEIVTISSSPRKSSPIRKMGNTDGRHRSPGSVGKKTPTNMTKKKSTASSPFVKSPSRSKKPPSTLEYLQTRATVALPTVEEPTVLEKPKLKHSPNTSPRRPISPAFGMIASVGEAIGALANKFQKSFVGDKVVPSKSKHIKADKSPQLSDIPPTKIADEPLSATKSYLSSFLEQKGISPVFIKKESDSKRTESVKDNDTRDEVNPGRRQSPFARRMKSSWGHEVSPPVKTIEMEKDNADGPLTILKPNDTTEAISSSELSGVKQSAEHHAIAKRSTEITTDKLQKPVSPPSLKTDGSKNGTSSTDSSKQVPASSNENRIVTQYVKGGVEKSPTRNKIKKKSPKVRSTLEKLEQSNKDAAAILQSRYDPASHVSTHTQLGEMP